MELNFFNTSNKIISAIAVVMAIMYGMVIIAAFVITLIVIIQRFYKNLLTDEGYLMFTLPVKAHSHITLERHCRLCVVLWPALWCAPCPSLF